MVFSVKNYEMPFLTRLINKQTKSRLLKKEQAAFLYMLPFSEEIMTIE
jgi:hypothetical protein